MGFGPRYKGEDPRVILQPGEQLSTAFGTIRMYDWPVRLERRLATGLGRRGHLTNVDFYSGLVYRKLGSPDCSRSRDRRVAAGWPIWKGGARGHRISAQIIRQFSEKLGAWMPRMPRVGG